MARHVVKLCRLADLPPGGSRGFSLSLPSLREDIFLVHTHAGVFAYRNSCPHTGGPLDWVADRFLNLDGDLIQCATHDALFRIKDGLCVQGPCSGQSLSALAVEICDGQICVSVEVSGDE